MLPTLRILVLAAVGLLWGCQGDEVLRGAPPGDDPADAADAGSAPADAAAAHDDAGDPLAPAVDYQDGLEVWLDTGLVRGVEDGALRIFKGIPYAEPPIGEARFRAPRPVEPWDGTLDASAYGPQCWQEPAPTLVSIDDMSEDCLNLNVFAHADARPRPVMVWIYGGAFILGGGSWSLYDGRDLARDGDAVVVTFNYRVGPLGFLATPALQADDPEGQVGNAGLLDQVELLRWVRRNIRAFGGDPDRVTIFGESAGGMSVCALLGAPRADGLFQRAISQSGGGCNTFSYPQASGGFGIPPAFETGADLVEALGCAQARDPVSCLKTLPPDRFAAALPSTSLFTGPLTQRLRLVPVIDGVVLPRMPIERLQDAHQAPGVEAIFGSNKDEGALFTMLDVVPLRATLRDLIVDNFGEALAEPLLELYPRSEFPLPKDAFQALLGEVVFNCGTLAAARALGERGRVYYFTQAPWAISALMGTIHAVDTIYTFGTFDALGVIPSAADREVSGLVQAAWSSFAASGAPSFPGGWPSYDPAAATIARFDAEPELRQEIRGGRCPGLHALGLVP